MSHVASLLLKLILRATNDTPSILIGHQDVKDYIDKIVKFAKIFTWLSDDEMHGAVAIYINEPNGKDAFITLVAISPEYRQQGIARSLLDAALSNAAYRGFRRCRLHVKRNNDAALNLYQSIGFVIEDENEDTLTLALDLITSPE